MKSLLNATARTGIPGNGSKRHGRSLRGIGCMATLVAIISMAVGCSSQPVTRFHSLMSTSPAASPNPAPSMPADGASATVPLFYELVPLSIPPQVDQPQFVVRNADDSFLVLEQERWIAPLADDMRGALMDRLATRFGIVELRQPLPNQRVAQRVRVDVLRFEATAGREVWLEANWSARVLADGGAVLNCRSDLRQPIGGNYNDIAAGQRQNVARLADQIGAAMKGLQVGAAAPACP